MKYNFTKLSIDEVKDDIKQKELFIKQKIEEMTKMRDDTSSILSKIQELEKRKRDFINDNYWKIRSLDNNALEDIFNLPENILKEKVVSLRRSLARNDEFAGLDQSESCDAILDEILKFVDPEILDIKQKKSELEEKLVIFKTLWEDIEKINHELNLTTVYLQSRIKESVAKALSNFFKNQVEVWITQEDIFECLKASL